MGKVPGFIVINPLQELDFGHSNLPDAPNSTSDLPPRKGYVACVMCKTMVWAPNSARHRQQCPVRHDPMHESKTVRFIDETRDSDLELLFCHEVLDKDDLA